MSQELQQTFDYGDLAPESTQQMESFARDAREHFRVAMNSRIELGRLLSEAHSVLADNSRDGMFKPWIEHHFPFSRSTAYRLMNMYQGLSSAGVSCPMLGHFDDRAASMLTREDVPEDATRQAAERAKKGEQITEKVAREIIASHRSEVDETANEDRDNPRDEAADNVAVDAADWEPDEPANTEENDDRARDESQDEDGDEQADDLPDEVCAIRPHSVGDWELEASEVFNEFARVLQRRGYSWPDDEGGVRQVVEHVYDVALGSLEGILA